MWKNWLWAKEKNRADEGGGERWGKLESRVETIEEKLTELHRKFDSVAELPLQWAATLQQLRRLAGHVTKSNAIDNRPQAAQNPPPAPRPLTQDDVIEIAQREVLR